MYQHGTTAPMGGGGGAGALGVGVISFPGLKYLLYVDKSVPATAGADGSQRRPYNTIGAALVKAVLLAPSATEQVGIYCYSGVYAESGLGLPAYVHLIGQSRDAVRIESAAGPLVVVTSAYATVRQITFRALAAAALVSVDGTAGAFAKHAEFFQCAFEGNNNNGNAVVVTAHALVRFTGCQLRQPAAATCILDVSTTSDGVELCGCELLGFGDVEGGDFLSRSSYWLSAGAYTLLLTGVDAVDLRSNVLLGAAGDVLRIGSTPTSSAILDNYMEATAGSDSIAIVAPGVVIMLGLENNVMVGGGIEGGIAPLSSFRRVSSSGDVDWYDTLAEAVASVDRDDVVIEMRKNEVLGAQVIAPAFDIIIDGRNLHTITGAMAGLLANSQDAETILRRVTLLGNVGADGGGSRITLEDVTMTGTAHLGVNCDLNAWLVLLRSSIVGTDQGAAIDIHDDSPSVRLYWSYVKGAAGINAIYWNNGQANPYVDLVSSTAMNGTTGIGSSPFGRNAAQVITFSACQCAFEVDPATFPGFTNDIAAGQQLNTLDVNADWI